MRGKWGNRFSRDPIGGLSDEYKAMKGYCPKEKFRRQWGETKLECIRQGREKKESWKVIDSTKGTYKPFSILWRDQGGATDPGAFAAARSIAQQCLQMSGRWCRIHPMTKRIEFLDLVTEFCEEHTKAWSLFQKSYTNKSKASEPETSENLKDKGKGKTAVKGNKGKGGKGRGKANKLQEQQVAPSEQAAEAGESQASIEPQATADEEAIDPGTPPKTAPLDGAGEPAPKKQKSDLDVVFASASVVKKDLSCVVMAVQNLLQQFERTGSSWGKWAQPEIETLKEQDAKLQGALSAGSGFGNEWVETENRDLKKKYKHEPQVLTHKLRNLVGDLQSHIKDVQHQFKSIMAMKEARDALVRE